MSWDCNEGGDDPAENVGNIGTVVHFISRTITRVASMSPGPVTNATIYNNTVYVGKNENVGLMLESDWPTIGE